MFRVETFDSIQSRIYELGDHFISAVQRRMRHDGKPASAMNQFNRVFCGHFKFWDECRTMFFQKTIKRLVHAGTKSALDQSPADMWPSRRAAVGDFENR